MSGEEARAPGPTNGRGGERIKRSLLILLALLTCCTAASAHPGKTDAQGGHWDSGSGGYHYHHGYPEHSHVNGVCPYDFDDRTGWNSGTGGSSGGSGGYHGSSYDNGSRTVEQVKVLQRYYGVYPDGKWGRISSAAAGGLTADEAWKEVFPSVTHISPKEYSTEDEMSDSADQEESSSEFTKEGKNVTFLLVILFFWWPISVIVRDIIEDYQRTKQKRVSTGPPDIAQPAQEPPPKHTDSAPGLPFQPSAKNFSREELNHRITADAYREYFGGRSIWETAEVPGWAYFDAQDRPHAMVCDDEEDPFTVYVTASGKRYHKESCRMAAGGKPVNLCDAVAARKTPCETCKPMREIPDFVRRYQFLKKVQREYGVDMLP